MDPSRARELSSRWVKPIESADKWPYDVDDEGGRAPIRAREAVATTLSTFAPDGLAAIGICGELPAVAVLNPELPALCIVKCGFRPDGEHPPHAVGKVAHEPLDPTRASLRMENVFTPSGYGTWRESNWTLEFTGQSFTFESAGPLASIREMEGPEREQDEFGREVAKLLGWTILEGE